jgi:hypothetical protein
MLKEVDFSKGVRGTHAGKVRIVGPVESSSTAAIKLRRSLESDLRKLGVLDSLEAAEKKGLRDSWDRKLEKALAD